MYDWKSDNRHDLNMKFNKFMNIDWLNHSYVWLSSHLSTPQLLSCKYSMSNINAWIPGKKAWKLWKNSTSRYPARFLSSKYSLALFVSTQELGKLLNKHMHKKIRKHAKRSMIQLHVHMLCIKGTPFYVYSPCKISQWSERNRYNHAQLRQISRYTKS